MKKFLLPIAVLSMFFFASCGGDGDGDGDGNEPELTEEQKAYLAKVESVEQNTKALYIKSTGTLCPPCGSWGWQVHDGVITQADGYIGAFSAYGNWHSYAKDLTSQASTLVDQQFGVNSFPTFLINNGIGGKMGKAQSGNTVQEYVDNVLGDVDAITNQEPIANAALKWEVANNSLTVNSRTRFFEDAEGEFYISIWVDEDGPTAPQAGYTNGIPAHHHVLRTATDQNAVFGVPLNNAGEMMPKDTLIERTHTAEFPEGLWKKENATVTAIIWNVSGNLTKSYNVVNVSTDTFTE
jgi:hypothetical protein